MMLGVHPQCPLAFCVSPESCVGSKFIRRRALELTVKARRFFAWNISEQRRAVAHHHRPGVVLVVWFRNQADRQRVAVFRSDLFGQLPPLSLCNALKGSLVVLSPGRYEVFARGCRNDFACALFPKQVSKKSHTHIFAPINRMEK